MNLGKQMAGMKTEGELSFETNLFLTVAQSGVQIYKANQQHPYKTYKFHEVCQRASHVA